jgi:DNA-binding GntR family transcriptional regulator
VCGVWIKKYISDLHEIRLAIEYMLVHKACRLIPAKALDKLIEIQKKYDLAIENSGSSDLLHQINKQFHLEIYSYSGNEEAVKLLASQPSAIRSLRVTFGFHPNRPPQVISKEHYQIIEAFCSGDYDYMESSFRNHMEKSRDEFDYFFELLDARA